jgi:hypothetical protein
MSYRISASFENIDTGNKEVLFDRVGSNCSFSKFINFENYQVQLRLDWDDLINGKPRLDADIKDKTTGIMLRKGPWHHTDPEFMKSEGRTIYTFRFKSLQLRLGTIMTMGIDLKADAVIVQKK